MADYIKITYDNGEVWRARYDKKNDRYCSDGVVYVSSRNASEVKLLPNEFLNVSYKELQEDKDIQVKEIIKEEYVKHSRSLMVEYFDEEVAGLEKELVKLRKEREKYL